MEDIVSEKYNLNGLNNILWGFIFVLVNIRVGGFDLLPDFIGYIFVLFGIAKLSDYGHYFTKAKPFAVLAMLLSFTDLFQINNQINSITANQLISFIITGSLSLIFRLFLYYYLISGIYIIAAGFRELDICQKSITLFILLVTANIFNFVIMLGLYLFPHTFLCFLLISICYSIIIFLSFLVFIKKSFSLLNGKIIVTKEDSAEKPFALKRAFSLFYLTFIILGVSCSLIFGELFYINNFVVQSEVYNYFDSSYSHVDIAFIKERMIQAGFKENDVADMPDSEILNYVSLKSVNKNENSFETDGGKCTVTSYSTSLSFLQGTVRIALFYRWDINPEHAYADMIGSSFNNKTFCLLQKEKEMMTSYSLYDKKDENNELKTYRIKDIKCSSEIKQYYKRFKVYNSSKITNQRGYIAYNLIFFKYTENIADNIMTYYSHQTSFLTLNKSPEQQFNGGTIEAHKEGFENFIFHLTVNNSP